MNRFEILFLSQKLTPQAIARNVSLQEVREVFQNILDHPYENKERYAAIKRMSSILRAGLYDQYLPRLDATKALLSTLSISASKREKYRRQCDKFFRKIENI